MVSSSNFRRNWRRRKIYKRRKNNSRKYTFNYDSWNKRIRWKKKNIIDLFCQYESENNLKDDIKEKHDDVLYEKQISFNEKKFLIKNCLILTLKEISESKLCNCFWNNKKEEKVIGYLEIDFKDFAIQNTIKNDFEFQDMTKKKKLGISIKVSLKIRKA